MQEGIARYWNTYRLRIEAMFTGLGVAGAKQWGAVKTKRGFTKRRQPVAIHKNTPATIAILRERHSIIKKALGSLTPLESNVIDLVFGFTNKNLPLSEEESASVLDQPEMAVNQALTSALNKLSKNSKLKDLL